VSGSVKSRRLLSGVLWSGQVRWVKAVQGWLVAFRSGGAWQGRLRYGMASYGGFGWVCSGALRPVMEWRLSCGKLR